MAMQGNPFKKYHRRRYFSHFFKRLQYILPLLLFFVWIFNSYIISTIKVRTTSMYPTLSQDSTFFIKRYPLFLHTLKKWVGKKENLHPLKQGDIIVINMNTSKTPLWKKSLSAIIYFISIGFIDITPKQIIVSRILATPKDTIQIDSKKIILNYSLFTPPWSIHYTSETIIPEYILKRDFFPQSFVPSEEFFILNDNWDIHNDSRNISFIHFDQIEGILFVK